MSGRNVSTWVRQSGREFKLALLARGLVGWLRVPDVVMAELTAVPEVYPRDWPRKPDNLRLFGYAGRGGPRKLWDKACDDAGIERIPFHSAGRHGFGQEMNVRQRVNEKAAGAFGGWSDLNLMRNTYTHAEDAQGKVNQAMCDDSYVGRLTTNKMAGS